MPANTIDSILAKFVMPVTESGCWIWTGCLNEAGYGVVSLRNKRGLAHRVIYKEMVGPIPNGLGLDHLCRVRCCVNPRHLEPVTGAVNTDRGHARRHTQCSKGHLYTEESRYIKKDGSSVCRICRRDHMRLLYGYQGKGHPRDRTHCPQGHEYSEENTYRTRDGHRMCRECGRASHREWWRCNRAKGAA